MLWTYNHPFSPEHDDCSIELLLGLGLQLSLVSLCSAHAIYSLSSHTGDNWLLLSKHLLPCLSDEGIRDWHILHIKGYHSQCVLTSDIRASAGSIIDHQHLSVKSLFIVALSGNVTCSIYPPNEHACLAYIRDMSCWSDFLLKRKEIWCSHDKDPKQINKF